MKIKDDLFQKFWPQVQTILGTPQKNQGFLSAALLAQAADHVQTDLAQGLSPHEREVIFNFQGNSEALIAMLRRWRGHSFPALASLCRAALVELAPDAGESEKRAVMVAAILGSVDNGLPYHNNRHYLNVLLHLIRLIGAHNQAPEQPFATLSAAQIACLLIAGCIHDLGHNGEPNHKIQGHLERRAYQLAEPYLKASGLSSETLADIKVMLLGTDVSSPSEHEESYVAILKDVFAAHSKGRKLRTDLPDELKPLAARKDLTIMALLLHEADIATSDGLNYALTKEETILLAREQGHTEVRPSQILSFLDRLCEGSWRSAASRTLFEANRAHIRKAAQDDVKAGDHPLRIE